MPLLSVVVPAFNVERYLDDCLSSIAGQTYRTLEVVVVDDGSTDATPAIAAEWAARDRRIRVVRQPNGGVGRARNTGVSVSNGDFLAFVDADDVLPPNGSGLLMATLAETGSDFATGNVRRLTEQGVRPSPMHRQAFTRSRARTHVSAFPDLLSDRLACNKVWRRDFWERHDLRFPEGVRYEDIPVTIPAHVLARQVDVVGRPVYFWRHRQDGDLSMSQRPLEARSLLDRAAALGLARAFVAGHGGAALRRKYDELAVANDWRYFMNVLDRGDEPYQWLFLALANDFLATAHPTVCGRLPAIGRLKWHLVSRRMRPELLEVVRFERGSLAGRRPVRRGGRWYGDYPFRTDPLRAIPRATYRLDGELQLRPRADRISLLGGAVRVEGSAAIGRIDLPHRWSSMVSVVLTHPPSGAWVRVRAHRTQRQLHGSGPGPTGRDWCGFVADVELGRLARRVPGDADWLMWVEVTVPLLRRRSRVVTTRRAVAGWPDDVAVQVRPLVSHSGLLTLRIGAHVAAAEPSSDTLTRSPGAGVSFR